MPATKTLRWHRPEVLEFLREHRALCDAVTRATDRERRIEALQTVIAFEEQLAETLGYERIHEPNGERANTPLLRPRSVVETLSLPRDIPPPEPADDADDHGAPAFADELLTAMADSFDPRPDGVVHAVREAS